jgi:hypothetical protein
MLEKVDDYEELQVETQYRSAVHPIWFLEIVIHKTLSKFL